MFLPKIAASLADGFSPNTLSNQVYEKGKEYYKSLTERASEELK